VAEIPRVAGERRHRGYIRRGKKQASSRIASLTFAHEIAAASADHRGLDRSIVPVNR
jgi:hypothetical protein